MFAFAVTQGSAAPASAPSLVGFWYGIGEPGDPEMFYIDAFSADGKFHAEYRKCEKGKLIYQQTQSRHVEDRRRRAHDQLHRDQRQGRTIRSLL